MSSDTETAFAAPIDGAKAGPLLTLEDLLSSESEVLRRVAQSQSQATSMSGHFSSTGGHNSSGQHSSHTSAQSERVLDHK
jgi:hypothetical protein